MTDFDITLALCPTCPSIHLEVKVDGKQVLSLPITDQGWNEIFVAHAQVMKVRNEREGVPYAPH